MGFLFRTSGFRFSGTTVLPYRNIQEKRRSIRKYLPRDVEDDKILQLMESARLAPSGSNTQPWRFVIVKNEKIKQKLPRAAHNQNWMLSAPVMIACIADGTSRIDEYAELNFDEQSPREELKQMIRDTSIAVGYLLLEATNIGLGSCWVAWFTQNEIRPILDIPSDKYVVGVITLGYAAEQPAPRPRKNLSELVHYEKWCNER
nr:nitroreductase family protein [Propionispira raffinosivorans]